MCKFSSFFSYVGGILATNHFSLRYLYFSYSANYITQKELLWYSFWLVAIFSTFGSLDTVMITTKSGQNTVKVIFTEQFLTKVAIFRCFDVCSVRPPQIFQVQTKKQQYGPCFQTIFPFLMTMFLFVNFIVILHRITSEY